MSIQRPLPSETREGPQLRADTRYLQQQERRGHLFRLAHGSSFAPGCSLPLEVGTPEVPLALDPLDPLDPLERLADCSPFARCGLSGRKAPATAPSSSRRCHFRWGANQ